MTTIVATFLITELLNILFLLVFFFILKKYLSLAVLVNREDNDFFIELECIPKPNIEESNIKPSILGVRTCNEKVANEIITTTEKSEIVEPAKDIPQETPTS